jgi:3'-phosphoadenosine 5'-phosphosulfate sulfotransferase (PAPS reductase)/FAD synthetase
MTDPFFLPPQSVLSFSGGRTSGYMLRRTLDAHGGALPPDRVVVFCNTGKERPETLDFVEECSQKWGVPIRWLEYRHEPGRHYFVEVSHETASRDGEPFRLAILAKNFLPNPVMRFCTGELKIKLANRFVRESLKWETYFNAIGLRADEPKRVLRATQKQTVTVEQTLYGEVKHVVKGAEHRPGETLLCPLADAGTRIAEVIAFWNSSPFDLRLPVDPAGKTRAGNCDACFLKGAADLVDLFREDPSMADWWIEAETWIEKPQTLIAGKFRKDRPSYYELKQIATGTLDAPGWLWADRAGEACGAIDDCACTD